MTTSDFLHHLFEYKPEDAHVLIWTYPEKRSFWTADLEAAAEYAQRQAPRSDVYFGVSLAEQAWGSGERLKRGEREPAGIYGMWADIDIAGPGHSDRKVYPPTPEDALRLVEDMGVRPSLIVQSGGGLHCHWIFPEPWMFDTEEERQEARILAWRWKETIRKRAGVRGWSVDSVSDLERVLRLPGTLNHKSDPPLPVQVLEIG